MTDTKIQDKVTGGKLSIPSKTKLRKKIIPATNLILINISNILINIGFFVILVTIFTGVFNSKTIPVTKTITKLTDNSFIIEKFNSNEFISFISTFNSFFPSLYFSIFGIFCIFVGSILANKINLFAALKALIIGILCGIFLVGVIWVTALCNTISSAYQPNSNKDIYAWLTMKGYESTESFDINYSGIDTGVILEKDGQPYYVKIKVEKIVKPEITKSIFSFDKEIPLSEEAIKMTGLSEEEIKNVNNYDYSLFGSN